MKRLTDDLNDGGLGGEQDPPLKKKEENKDKISNNWNSKYLPILAGALLVVAFIFQGKEINFSCNKQKDPDNEVKDQPALFTTQATSQHYILKNTTNYQNP